MYYNGRDFNFHIQTSTPIAKTLNTGYLSFTINKPSKNTLHLPEKPHSSRFRLSGLSSNMHIHALKKQRKILVEGYHFIPLEKRFFN